MEKKIESAVELVHAPELGTIALQGAEPTYEANFSSVGPTEVKADKMYLVDGWKEGTGAIDR